MGCRSKRANWKDGHKKQSPNQGVKNWERKAKGYQGRKDLIGPEFMAQINRNLAEKQSEFKPQPKTKSSFLKRFLGRTA